MALVLQAKGRGGEIKRFDVVRAENGEDHEILQDIKEGTYHILDGSTVRKVHTSYRTVQDIVPLDD